MSLNFGSKYSLIRERLRRRTSPFLEQTQVSRILKTTTTTNKISPKRRLQCQINIEVLQIADNEEVEAPKTIKTSIERTNDRKSPPPPLLHESDSTIISKQFQTFIYPFHLSNEFFTIIVDLRCNNRYNRLLLMHVGGKTNERDDSQEGRKRIHTLSFSLF